MFITRKLKNSGVRVAIIARGTTEDRLRTTCFRGNSLRLAGNFSRWHTVNEVFSEPEVIGQFLASLEEDWEKRDFGTTSVSFMCSTPVGWESTDRLDKYTAEDLEPYRPNRKSSALRVKPTRTDLLAPATSELTIVYELKAEEGEPVAIIHSIYPGSDVGDLKGDFTKRENRVFFDWNHPGQQL